LRDGGPVLGKSNPGGVGICDILRFSTYAIRAAAESGEISLNGAAARKAMIGDLLIIAAYSGYSEDELAAYQPIIVLVDEHNRPKSPHFRRA
jgi:aspartate 1-decarboxylase